MPARELVGLPTAVCLTKMGAQIEGIGHFDLACSRRRLSRRPRYTPCSPDRIETGTYAMAVAAAGGDVLLEGARGDLLQEALNVLRQAGVQITETNHGIRVARNGAGLAPVNVETQPFPGFPPIFRPNLWR